MTSTISFTAIDFETANEFRGSACAVGLAKVVNGTVVDEKSLLFKPPEGHQRFDPFNTLIHGITAADVEGKPEFKEIWPDVLEYIDGDPLVAHNAAFDLGVVREALGASNMAWPDLEYLCTLVISRKAVKGLLSYSLPYVAAALDLEEFEHHQAQADARMSALILLAIANNTKVTSLENVLETFHVRKGTLSCDAWRGCVSRHPERSEGSKAL